MIINGHDFLVDKTVEEYIKELEAKLAGYKNCEQESLKGEREMTTITCGICGGTYVEGYKHSCVSVLSVKINQLEAENKRYREALKKIQALDSNENKCSAESDFITIQDFVDEALKEAEK